MAKPKKSALSQTPTIELSVDDENDASSEVITTTIVEKPGEGFGASPLEDRFGRHLWVRTRMCFCPNESKTDCRFHPQTEPGWEECPHLKLAKSNSNVKGLWLWAKNPLYGKPLTEDEIKERDKLAA